MLKAVICTLHNEEGNDTPCDSQLSIIYFYKEKKINKKDEQGCYKRDDSRFSEGVCLIIHKSVHLTVVSREKEHKAAYDSEQADMKAAV